MEIPDEISVRKHPAKTIEICMDLSQPSWFDTEIASRYKKRTHSSQEAPANSGYVQSPQRNLSIKVHFKDPLYKNTLEESESSSDKRQSELPYKNLFLHDRSSDRVIAKFLEEPYELIPSRITVSSFSVESCLERVQEEYDIILFGYTDYKPVQAKLSATEEGFTLTIGKQRKFHPFCEYSGVLLGTGSSTFSLYKDRVGALGSRDIRETDCLTVVGEWASVNIAAVSQTAKYDIFLVLNWFISAKSRAPSILPVSKGKLTMEIVKIKLRRLAEEKSMFLNELLLLGILKSLILNKYSEEKINIVKTILDKRFSLIWKIYRIYHRMKPVGYVRNPLHIEKFEELLRVRALQGRMAYQIRTRVLKKPILGDWRSVKQSYTQLSNIGNLKSLVPKAKLVTVDSTAEDTDNKISLILSRLSSKAISRTNT